MNVIKQREIGALAAPWVNSQVAYLLAVQQATATVEDNEVATREVDTSGYDEIVTTKDTETLFFPWYTYEDGTAHTVERINVMTQALHAEDGS